LYYGLGRLEEMTALADRCRPAVERYATPLQRGKFFQSLLLVGFRTERYALTDETLAHARASLDAFRESGDANAATQALGGLGFALLWAGRLHEAEAPLLTCLEQAERGGDVATQSRSLTYLTVLYRMRGQVDQARRFAVRSLDLATEQHMLEYIGMAKAGMAWLAWREGDASAARVSGEAAVEMWLQAPLSTPFQWTARLPLLATCLGQEQLPDAIGHAQAVLQPDQQRLPPAFNLQLERAVVAWQRGDRAAASACLWRALERARESGFL
jgi:tetratricopeptide (TPR) repeat protein